MFRSAAVHIRPLHATEWMIYRDLRLRALLDAPDAFSRTYAEEKDRADEEWSKRLSAWADAERRLALVAIMKAQPLGIAFVQVDAERNAELFSMWVDPAARQSGIGSQLVSTAISWARERGARKMQLQVTEGNVAAIKLYERAGFAATADVVPLRSGSPLMVRSMVLDF